MSYDTGKLVAAAILLLTTIGTLAAVGFAAYTGQLSVDSTVRVTGSINVAQLVMAVILGAAVELWGARVARAVWRGGPKE